MSERLPAETIEAAVTVCGRAYHLKAPLQALFEGCGVPPHMWLRYATPEANKYAIARHIFGDLNRQGESGQQVLRSVITELANLSRPHPSVDDKSAGLAAIAELKAVATAQRVLSDPEDARRRDRSRQAGDRSTNRDRRARALSGISRRVSELHRSSGSPQARGFELEKLLVETFAAFEMTYRPSYRLEREQVDGAFDHRGLTYLVEARWRAGQPTFGDLADFKANVDGKLDSTRGMFLSMGGFDEGIVDHFMNRAGGSRNNLILFDGLDLMAVLENTFELSEALDYKIGKAAQEGKWWSPLRERYT